MKNKEFKIFQENPPGILLNAISYLFYLFFLIFIYEFWYCRYWTCYKVSIFEFSIYFTVLVVWFLYDIWSTNYIEVSKKYITIIDGIKSSPSLFKRQIDLPKTTRKISYEDIKSVRIELKRGVHLQEYNIRYNVFPWKFFFSKCKWYANVTFDLKDDSHVLFCDLRKWKVLKNFIEDKWINIDICQYIIPCKSVKKNILSLLSLIIFFWFIILIFMLM